MSSSRLRAAAAALALAMTMTATACTDDPEPAPENTVTVFAAASLTEAFNRIGRNFEAAHPGKKVTFNFAGSSALATQINEGAPADVFAAASPATMKTVTGAGNADGQPVVFARNQLVIAVPKGNPKGLRSLQSLTRPDVKVALCAEQVPCGAAARQALSTAGVRITPVTLEQDVKAALSKVKLGEVDAALVYRTGAKAAPDAVDGIDFPESADAINDYLAVALQNAPKKDLAKAFVAFLATPPARAVLLSAGFQAP
jgi:molybdate transport system substrate-binding protein